MADYKDEIVGGDGIRRYDLIRSDGTYVAQGVEISKAYTPEQEGSPFGATQVNEIYEAMTRLESKAVTATLTAAGWTTAAPYTQTIEVEGLPAGGNAIVSLAAEATDAQRTACRAALISPTARADSSITFTADGYQPPAVDLPLLIVAVESTSSAAATITNALPGGQKQAVKRVELCRFTASGTFNPANYPTVDGLYDVLVCGAGAGGGAAKYTTSSDIIALGGNGGRIRLLRDIAATASVAVTIGAGGGSGVNGGTTKFGTYSAEGGGNTWTSDNTDIHVNPYDNLEYGNDGGAATGTERNSSYADALGAATSGHGHGGGAGIVGVNAVTGKAGTGTGGGGAAAVSGASGRQATGGAGGATSGGGGAVSYGTSAGGAGGSGLVIVYGAPKE